MSDCLHCDINELVRKHVEGNAEVDLVELAARMVESLADLILLAPQEEQGSLLAQAIAHLGQAFLDNGDGPQGETAH
jgi:hypothetical protein